MRHQADFTFLWGERACEDVVVVAAGAAGGAQFVVCSGHPGSCSEAFEHRERCVEMGFRGPWCVVAAQVFGVGEVHARQVERPAVHAEQALTGHITDVAAYDAFLAE